MLYDNEYYFLEILYHLQNLRKGKISKQKKKEKKTLEGEEINIKKFETFSKEE